MKILREWLGGSKELDLDNPTDYLEFWHVVQDQTAAVELIARIRRESEVVINVDAADYIERYTVIDAFTRSPLARIAEAFDRNTDEDSQWNGADICDDVVTILLEQDAMRSCPAGHAYAATKAECPFHDRGPCILTGADGENADDCTTHLHEGMPWTRV